VGVILGLVHGGNNMCRLRMFEDNVLRKIFGPKREEVRGDGRKMQNVMLVI
jgi:hypothetical protein